MSGVQSLQHLPVLLCCPFVFLYQEWLFSNDFQERSEIAT